MKRLTIITVNYFSSEFVKQLSAGLKLRNDVAWFVVDNSNDKNEYQKLTSIKNITNIINPKKNLGFGRANNLAFKKVRSQYVMFLNPDTDATSFDIDRLIDYMDENADVGMIGPKIVNYDNDVQISVFRKEPNIWTHTLDYNPALKMLLNKLGINSNPMAFTPQPTGITKEAQSILGACMLMRSKDLVEVGKFDSKFFLYREETDLSHRLIKNGKKIAYYPFTSIKHMSGGASKNSFYAELDKDYTKSSYIYFSKWHSIIYVWLSWVLGLVGTMFSSIVLGILGLFIMKDNFRLLRIAWRALLCSIRHVLHPLALGYYYRYI